MQSKHMDTSSNQNDIETQRGPSRGNGRDITIEVLLHATKLSVSKHEHLSHYLKRITHLALNGNGNKALLKSGSDNGAFRKIQNLHHCPNLKVLYLYDNEVDTIENLDAVPQLTQLHLQGNCLRKIENLESLKLLEKLYLEKNSISRLEGLTMNSRLQELHAANQNVPIGLNFSFEEDTMHALATSLRVLDLSNCRVADTKPLSLLRSLEKLDLCNNMISDLEDVFALVRTSLVELDMRGNPVTSTVKYREKTITFSSARLALLDKKDVDPNQRRMMQSHLAHKYRKRIEPSLHRLSPVVNEERRADLTSRPSETAKLPRHDTSGNQLVSKRFAPKYRKARLERDGLGIDGASCSPSSTALVKMSNNNSKYD